MKIEPNEMMNLLLPLDLQYFAEGDQPEGFLLEPQPTPEPQNFGMIEPPAPVESSTYKVKHNGQEMDMTIDQLIENAQKGFDYTQKSQQVSQWLQFEEQLKNDPEFANYLAQSIDQYGQPQGNPYNQAPQQAQINPQEQQLRLMEQQLQQLQGYLFSQETDRQFNDFASKNPDAVEQRDQLEKFLNENPKLNYEDAYFLLNREKLMQQQAQQFTDNQMNKQKARVLSNNTGGAGMSSPSAGGGMTPEDALKQAILSNSGNIFGN